ncbi:MAG: hypothetical protein ACYTFW_02565 [Planctomycetota bacterium]|jgi:hypothetical protein
MSEQERRFLQMARTNGNTFSIVTKEEPNLNMRERLFSWMAKRFSVDLEIKKTESVIPEYFYEQEPKIRKPQYDYFSLMVKAIYYWPIRTIIEAIIRESLRNGGRIEPRFKYMCDHCGTEYNKEIESCETMLEDKSTCTGKLIPPNYKQRIRFREIKKEPSEGRTFDELIHNTMFYANAVDDYYWHITYKKREYGHTTGDKIYMESSAFIFPVADMYGHLGGYEFYCPSCYSSPKYKGMDLYWNMREEMERRKEKVGNVHAFRCPTCRKRIMVQTAYVQQIAGKIVARFGKNEIIHGSLSRLAPSLFGNPRIVSVVKPLDYMDATDERKREGALEQKTNGLLFFPGMDKDAVKAILDRVAEERTKLTKRDVQTGTPEVSKRNALVFIGMDDVTEKPIKIPIMEDDTKIGTLEFYQLYLHALADMFGVVTVLKPVKVSGGDKTFKVAIEVQDKTIAMAQKAFTSTFNEILLPRFGITDWIWVFNKIESKDKLRDAQVKQQIAVAALTYLQGGFEVEIDEHGELLVSGKGKLIMPSHIGQPNQKPGQKPENISDGQGTRLETSPSTGEERTS